MIAFRYDEEQRLGIALWGSEVTAEDWLAQTAQRVGDPTMMSAQRVLADIRLWTPHEVIDDTVIREIARSWGMSRVVAGKPVAIVANADHLDARIFAKTTALYGLRVVVFNVLDTACSWLDIDPDRTSGHLAEMVAELSETRPA